MSLLSWQFFCFCENSINDRTFCNIDILKFIVADAIPSRRAMLLQIYVAMKAMPWYSVLPTISEYMTEIGWTKSFPRIYHIGWAAYLVYLAIYVVIVEFGIYWMHRELHDIKPLYKYLHATHHIYNKQNTLSPFAGKLLTIHLRFLICCGSFCMIHVADRN